MIGEANQMFTFGRFEEAIPLFEKVLKEMPALADVTHQLAMCHLELGNLEKALIYAKISATESRTDSDKWQQCADIALRLNQVVLAKKLLNRAVGSLNPSQHQEILQLKMRKFEIYRQQQDYGQIHRSIAKLINYYESLTTLEPSQKEPVFKMLKKIKYETFYKQG